MFTKEWSLGDLLGKNRKDRITSNDKIFTHPFLDAQVIPLVLTSAPQARLARLSLMHLILRKGSGMGCMRRLLIW